MCPSTPRVHLFSYLVRPIIPDFHNVLASIFIILNPVIFSLILQLILLLFSKQQFSDQSTVCCGSCPSSFYWPAVEILLVLFLCPGTLVSDFSFGVRCSCVCYYFDRFIFAQKFAVLDCLYIPFFRPSPSICYNFFTLDS